MMYVGIDLHRKRSHITAMDEDGQVTLRRRIANDPDSVRALMAEVGPGARVALEATYGWDWLAELLEDEGYDLRLAHPLGTRAIAAARVKTDAVDSATLAHLLRADLLPEAYLAPRELRDLRELLRLRIFLTRLRTGAKNRVHALLARHGLSCPRADLFGKAGRAWLAEAPLRAEPARRVDALCRVVDDLEREIGQLAAEIEARAAADERVEALCAIRGIGRYTAMLIVAEVGPVERFPSARHLCAWAGLTPTIRSSDGKARLGHISRQGSPALRWALVEAAQKAVQGAGPLRASFERISKRRGRKIAKVAVARQILTLCFYGLRNGQIRCLAPEGQASTSCVVAGAH